MGTNITSAPILLRKIGTFTRDLTTASGNVAYTGVGFKPVLVIFLSSRNAESMCVGIDDGTVVGEISSTTDLGFGNGSTESILMVTAVGSSQAAKIQSFDSNGFTLAWTKTGTPTGTGQIYYLALG